MNRYLSGAMVLCRHDKSNYRLDVQVRAYDEGIAVRYFFPEHPAAIFHKVVDDLTSYTLPEGTKAWSEQRNSNTHVRVSEKEVSSKDTLKFQLQGSGCVAIRFEKL